jgi:hypothetical protein
MNAMLILVQDCDSHQFLGADEEWTADPEKAQDFFSTAAALNASTRLRERSHRVNLQILLKFSQSALDIALPLVGSDC